MTRTVKVTCDNCNADLYKELFAPSDYLSLLNEHSISATMPFEPVLGGSKHFCGYGCLKNWIDEIIK
jgi:hypothetical protein